jgi:iron complex outermembrane receptor protein
MIAQFSKTNWGYRALLLSTAMGAAWANPAMAQTAAGVADHPEAASSGLEEITVTATRRSVDLQRVAGTVEAFPASTLKARGITNVLQLADVVPGIQVAPTGGNNIYLRGVGTTSAGYNEAQVAVYVDGLYLPNPAMGIYSFNNIEQVEVLKGPQGTLYGRNVTAGLVSITTRDPDLKAFHVDASIGYSNYDTFTQSFYGSVPLADSLAANVAVYNSQQNKGWGKNVFTGTENDKSKETGVEAKLLWRPSDATKVTATFIYDHNDRDTPFNWEIVPGTLANDGTAYLGKYRNSSRIDPYAPLDAYIGSLKIQQDLGFARLMSLTGYQKSDQHVLLAANTAQLGQPAPGGVGTSYIEFRSGSRTWSQEFQLTSNPSSSRLDWVAGFFYYHDQTTIAADGFNTCVGAVCSPSPIPPNRNTGIATTSSYSGYGDLNYRVFDGTHLTLGLRYTDESKSLAGIVVPLAGFPNSVTTLPASVVTYPGQPFTGFPNGIPTSLNFKKLTYRFVVAQDFGDDVHAYASLNRGFKSGTFNINSFSNPPVRPEILDAYEVGLKSEFFDRKLRLNVSYFNYDYKDVQLRSTAPPAIPGTSILQNVAVEKQQGVDLDFSLAPASGLTINGGFEILDAKYKSFPGSTCATPGPTGKVTSVPCDLSGYNVALAAPFSGSLGFVYKLDTSAGVFALGANYHYEARHSLTPDAAIYAPASNVFDSNLTWTSTDKHYDVHLFVKNLTNEYRYVNAAVSANAFSFIPGAPRTFGISVGFHQ